MTAGDRNEGPAAPGLARAAARGSRIHSPVVGNRMTSGATTPGEVRGSTASPGTPSQSFALSGDAEPGGSGRDGHFDRLGDSLLPSDLAGLRPGPSCEFQHDAMPSRGVVCAAGVTPGLRLGDPRLSPSSRPRAGGRQPHSREDFGQALPSIRSAHSRLQFPTLRVEPPSMSRCVCRVPVKATRCVRPHEHGRGAFRENGKVVQELRN